MQGRASKQTYLGRVIAPAKFHAGAKPFISFTLFVDKLAVNKAKEKSSGKIGCSYSIMGDNDPVGLILCRIASKEDPSTGGLNGVSYKSVEVLVEGTERLTEVTDKEGNIIPNAYYKSLDYCSIQVADSDVLKLYKNHIGKGSSTQQQEESPEQETANPNPFTDTGAAPTQQRVVQQPTQAPAAQRTVTAKPAPVAQAQPAQQVKKEYKVGDRLVHSEVEYEFRGGNPADLKNWVPVKQLVQQPPVAQAVNPFEAAAPTAMAEATSTNPFEA